MQHLPLSRRAARAGLLLAALVLFAPACVPIPNGAVAPRVSAPALLSQTGLYVGPAGGDVAADVRAYTPQYPLWTDGAAKRRWVLLPAGATIDARDPDAWSFPVGTRFWKEFSFGRRVETRYMERTAAGEWLYATYVWRPDGSDAVLAPEEGQRAVCATGERTAHDVPSLADCRACHDAHPSGVLGFGALQLASERDPLAPHAEVPTHDMLDLDELLAEGRLDGSRAAVLAAAAPIEARSPRERAALGYLHGNCAGCHNASGPLAGLGLDLEVRGGRPAALRTAVDRPSAYRPTGVADPRRLASGEPARSALFLRLASRFGPTQMPPLGTHVRDDAALALVGEWITTDLAASVAALTERP